jgi:hypothetical protein
MSLGMYLRLAIVRFRASSHVMFKNDVVFGSSPWYTWIECWMRRNASSELYSGWQVLDPSSIQDQTRNHTERVHSLSGGFSYDYLLLHHYCHSDTTRQRITGPCSVVALKSSAFSLPWDTSDIYRVLHGDRTVYFIDTYGHRSLISKTNRIHSL